MKKPKKTLKELGRIEAVLSKQTSRSAKLLARRKTGEADNPVTSRYYDHMADQQAVALADLSEIIHLRESLSRHVMEADAERAAKKAAKATRMAHAKTAAGPARAAKPVAKVAAKPASRPATKVAAKASPAKPAAAKPAVKRPARRAPTKTTGA